ncbi:MAG: hypothetical protein V4757_19405 [Pseudomonadota bacterium]
MSFFHPIFSVVVRKPDLVIEHLAGYAALAQEEASAAGTRMAGRIAAWAAVLVCGSMFLTLAGVAVMLGVVMDRFNWALVLVPGSMLAMAAIAAGIARQPLPPGSFSEMKKQIDADVQALRVAGENS